MPHFLRFTDAQGRRWRAYEFSIIAGRTLYARPGERSSQYRGFVPEEAGPGSPARRRYMIFKPAERATDVATMQLQLALADIDPRDDPTHPLNRQRSG